jgi:hypothetical protein
MKKNHFLYSAMFLIAAIVISTSVSCKKDDDGPKSNTETISGKKFKVTAMTIDPAVEVGGNTITDLFSFMPDCSKDDYMVMNSDGTATFDEGATKCEPDDPQTESGTWAFLDNETKLSVTYDGDTEVYNIIELTESVLKISFEVVEDLGNGEENYTYYITYTAF